MDVTLLRCKSWLGVLGSRLRQNLDDHLPVHPFDGMSGGRSKLCPLRARRQRKPLQNLATSVLNLYVTMWYPALSFQVGPQLKATTGKEMNSRIL